MADFITDLCQIAAEELLAAPQASTKQLTERLKVAVERQREWQIALQSDVRLVMINQGDVTAYQTLVLGGIANIGTHLHGVDEAKLAEVVREVLRSFQPVGIPQNLPSNGTTTFVGRETDMTALHEQLQQRERVVIASSIHGMGGIGKTELALQYALRHLAEECYSGGICWLRSREEVGTQIVSFARSQLSLEPPEDWELLEQVKWCWRNWQAGEVLVVLDDVQQYADVEPFLPPAGERRFKVVITTRLLKIAKSVQDFEIKVLDEASALNLLRAIVSDGRIDQDLETAKQLCEWLGYLPLGLELVGQYLEHDADVELSSEDEDCPGLWQRLQKTRLDAIALKQTYSGMTATDGVAAAFELSWQQLKKAEQRLAALLSLFALAEIPWVHVRACLPNLSVEELEVLRNRKLLGLHLLQWRRRGMYQLHQLIREFFAAKRSLMPEEEEMKRSFCAVMIEIGKQIPQTVTLDVIDRVKPAIPHLKEVATTLRSWLTDEELITPSIRIARFYEGQSSFGEAEEWYVHCQEIATQRFGHDHLKVATTLSNLAALYITLQRRERFAEAETLFVRSLEIRQRHLGQDHKDIANSLNNLSQLYWLQERYAEAEPLCLQSLKIWQQQLGADHPDVALSLNNLAGLYESQGRYAEAEPLYLQSLKTRQQQLGADHPDVAQSLRNLAHLYELQGRYEEAELLYLQSLEIYQRQLGEDHPDVAYGLIGLAGLYSLQERYRDAEQLSMQALKICQQQLGETHISVVPGLLNLASSYQARGRYEEAEGLLVQLLKICQQQLGEDHPVVAGSLNELGFLYRLEGRYEKAEPMFQKALRICQQLRQDHPQVTKSLRNLAELYRLQGRYEEAESLYLQALKILQQQLRQDHLDAALIMNELAGLYRLQGRYEEAEPMFLQALTIKQQQFGQDHQGIATSLNDLALLYNEQGRYQEAEPLYLQALEIYQQRLGQDHPYVATSAGNLAFFYQSQERYKEAEPLYLQALEIQQRYLGQDHPDIATTLNNLAVLYRLQGRYSEAEPLSLQSISILQNQAGVHAIVLARVLGNLAFLYDLQERYSEAELFYLQALSIFSAKLEENHEWRQEVSNKFRSLLQKAIQENRTNELSNDPMTRSLLQQLQNTSE